MQEGLSYIAGSEVPCVLVDIMRGGPGLGNIQPSQSDYFQITRSAGHGDFRPLVLAPATIQEAVDLMYGAFDLAFRYRTIVILAGDGALGQMMEPVTMPPMHADPAPRPDWAIGVAAQHEARVITSLYLAAERLEETNLRLQAKLHQIEAAEQRWESYQAADAEVLIVAFGTVARIAKSAVRMARAEGLRAGLFRPISLWPYPMAALRAAAASASSILVVEMNAGQMVDDVRLALGDRLPIRSLGRMGGVIPLPDEIVAEAVHMRKVVQSGNSRR